MLKKIIPFFILLPFLFAASALDSNLSASSMEVLDKSFFLTELDYGERSFLIKMAAYGIMNSGEDFNSKAEVLYSDAIFIAAKANNDEDSVFTAENIDIKQKIFNYAVKKSVLTLEEANLLYSNDKAISRQDFVGLLSVITGARENSNYSVLDRYSDSKDINPKYRGFYTALSVKNAKIADENRLLRVNDIADYDFVLKILSAFEETINKQRNIFKTMGHIKEKTTVNGTVSIAIETTEDNFRVSVPAPSFEKDFVKGNIPVIYKGQLDMASILEKGDELYLYAVKNNIILLELTKYKEKTVKYEIVRGSGYVFNPETGQISLSYAKPLGGAEISGITDVCVSPKVFIYRFENAGLKRVGLSEINSFLIDKPVYVTLISQGGVKYAITVLIN